MIKVYELKLPIIDVSALPPKTEEPESPLGNYLGSLKPTIIDEITQESIEQQFNEVSNTNEENDWINQNQQLGELGELLAEAYLKERYQQIKIVSEDASLGYDIEAYNNHQQLQFEVKTAQNHFGFHITKNELIKAATFRDTYHLFFIKLNDEDEKNIKIDGYIIQNPVEIFNLDVKELLHITSNPFITYQANRFFIRLVPSALGAKLNLSHLI